MIDHPFWVDEFSSGVQARLIYENGLSQYWKNPDIIENNNVFTHIIIAVSYKVFGISERSSRIPFVIFGSLVVLSMYFIGKKIANYQTGLVASALTAFSYFEIIWSVQARGYVLQQLLSALLFLIVFSLLDKIHWKKILPLVLLSALGLLTHSFFSLIIASIIIFVLFINRQLIKTIFFSPAIWIVILLFIAMFILLGYMNSIITSIAGGFLGFYNHLWYYHAFLWREQTIIIALSVLGIVISVLKKNKTTYLILITIMLHMFFITFIWGHYLSKYVFPVFHFIILFSSIAIVWVGDELAKISPLFKSKLILSKNVCLLVIVLLIIINGDSFATRPRQFYSVNHFMRDIALLDYDEVYNRISSVRKKYTSDIPIIETWPDRVRWYMGYSYTQNYWFRWANAGFHKETHYEVSKNGDKYIPKSGKPDVKYLDSLEDLLTVMGKYPQGFIFIDDTSLPADVIEYANANLRKELYLDHYAYDDNPYSIWPATLYSWGFEEELDELLQ